MARQRKMKRERLIRESLGGHGNAQKAHLGKEGSGCWLDSGGSPYELQQQACLYSMTEGKVKAGGELTQHTQTH